MDQLVNIAKEFAISKHNEVNHKYAGEPYSNHLEQVVQIANSFPLDYDPGTHAILIAACWCHDLIEDCRITYHDLCANVCPIVAEIVYDLTDELGKNRFERAIKTYPKLSKNPMAIYVKLCDRIANMTQSTKTKSGMGKKYLSESVLFEYCLRPATQSEFRFLWDLYDKKKKELEIL